MHIDASEARGVEDRFRQDEPVSRNNRGVQRECREGGLFGGVAEGLRRSHRQSIRRRPGMNRRQPLFLPAAGGPRRLRINGGDFVAGLGQSRQTRHREIRRPHEGQSESAHIVYLIVTEVGRS